MAMTHDCHCDKDKSEIKTVLINHKVYYYCKFTKIHDMQTHLGIQILDKALANEGH